MLLRSSIHGVSYPTDAFLYQVCANLMEYCQTLLLQSSNQAQFSICLFSPSASEPAGRDGGRAGQSDCIHTVEEGKKYFRCYIMNKRDKFKI